MHRIAAYRLVARDAEDTLPNHREVALELLEGWLDAKCAAGAFERGEGGPVPFPMGDGWEATLEHDRLTVDGSSLDEYDLVQSDGRTRRRMTVRIAAEGELTEVYVELFAVSESPVGVRGRGAGFDTGCPRFVRDLLRAGYWCTGEMPLTVGPIAWRGGDEARRLERLLRHEDRVLPVVTVSLTDAGPVSTDFPARLAERLAGAAAVATVDEEAAWGLTRAMGREWSCFGGAVRLYWPMHDGDEPRDHPLWTLARLRGLDASPSAGGNRLIRDLEREAMGHASRTLHESPLLERVRERVRLARREQFVRDNETLWTTLAADVEGQLDAARDTVRRLRDRNERLERELADRDNEIAVLRHEMGTGAGHPGALSRRADATSLAPDEPPPAEDGPRTVVEAVDDARTRHAGLLVFGDGVAASVRELSPDAGPPDKVARHLDVLAEMATTLREDGSLGKQAQEWLKDRNVNVSGYGEQIARNGKACAKRTFHDGTGRRVFMKHTKPNDGTASDLCVRIYFEVSEDRRSVLIGYVGRHL